VRVTLDIWHSAASIAYRLSGLAPLHSCVERIHVQLFTSDETAAQQLLAREARLVSMCAVMPGYLWPAS
jgi:hypothetical protein